MDVLANSSGVALSAVIWRLQARLLRWQRHDMVE
jgi:hypothetical protein